MSEARSETIRRILDSLKHSPAVDTASSQQSVKVPERIPSQSNRQPGKLVGRDPAIAQLQDRLHAMLRHQRQVVFITGESGIGKTALVDEFQRRTAAEVTGLHIARGQCIEGYGEKEAYYPMLKALGELCGVAGDSIVQTLAMQAPTWLISFPHF
jgi:Cdc6-like AAA superfamily ATPase